MNESCGTKGQSAAGPHPGGESVRIIIKKIANPYYIIPLLAVLVLLAETVVMVLTARFPGLSIFWIILIDSLLIICIFLPVIYVLILKAVRSSLQERDSAELALLRERNFISTAINSLPGVFYLFDDKGKMVLWNRNLETISGYSYQEISAMTPFDFFSTRNGKTARDAINEVIETGESTVELDILTRQGNRVPYYFTGLRLNLDNRVHIVGMGIDMSSRRGYEDKLRAYNSLLTSLVESPTYVMIYSVDRNFNYTFFNTAYKKEMKKLWGVDIEKGKNMLEYIQTEDERTKIRERFEHVFSGEQFNTIEEYGSEKNAAWYELSYSPIFRDSNEVSGATVYVTDITERKRIEEALIESEEHFRKLSEAAMEGIALTEKGVFVDVNSTFADMFGYEREEIAGMKVDKLIAPEFLESSLEKILSGYENPYESVCIRKNGERFPVEVCGKSIQYMGRMARVTAIRDITERKKAEEAVLNIAKGVSAEVGEKFFYSMAEYLIRILDADYAYVAEVVKGDGYHARTLSLFADGEAIDNVEVDLSGTPCEQVLDHNVSSFASNVQGRFPHALMMAKMNVEGYAGIPLYDSSGHKLGLMAVMYRKPIENVPMVESTLRIFAARAQAELERREYELDLQKAKEEIEAWNRELERRVEEKTEELVKSQAQLIQSEKLSAMGHMAGGLAHELNSPLAGLLPLIRKFQSKAQSGTKEYHELSLMMSAGEYMAKIVRDFCLFARTSASKAAPIDVVTVIEDTMSFAVSRLKQKGIAIDRQYEYGLPKVKGEKTELQQVVLNILSNAYDAIGDNGKIIIKVYAAADTDDIIMEFTDNGCGMDRNELNRVFDPFFTTKAPGEGTGLGLSVSYGIIHKHGGEISVQSEPGKGTTFSIRLPAYKAGDADKESCE